MTVIAPPAPSPLMLCDRLIGLAQDADRAGLVAVAGRLLALVDRMFEDGRPGKRAYGGWIGHA
jgi:hypothetical protein